MRRALILAAGVSLLAAAAHAQFQQPERIPGVPEIPKIPGQPKMPSAAAMAPPAFKPWQPPRTQSVYAPGVFSPEAEAKRAQRAGMAPPGGPFSPEAEAKRQREAAKGFQPF